MFFIFKISTISGDHYSYLFQTTEDEPGDSSRDLFIPYNEGHQQPFQNGHSIISKMVTKQNCQDVIF